MEYYSEAQTFFRLTWKVAQLLEVAYYTPRRRARTKVSPIEQEDLILLLELQPWMWTYIPRDDFNFVKAYKAKKQHVRLLHRLILYGKGLYLHYESAILNYRRALDEAIEGDVQSQTALVGLYAHVHSHTLLQLLRLSEQQRKDPDSGKIRFWQVLANTSLPSLYETITKVQHIERRQALLSFLKCMGQRAQLSMYDCRLTVKPEAILNSLNMSKMPAGELEKTAKLFALPQIRAVLEAQCRDIDLSTDYPQLVTSYLNCIYIVWFMRRELSCHAFTAHSKLVLLNDSAYSGFKRGPAVLVEGYRAAVLLHEFPHYVETRKAYLASVQPTNSSFSAKLEATLPVPPPANLVELAIFAKPLPGITQTAAQVLLDLDSSVPLPVFQEHFHKVNKIRAGLWNQAIGKPPIYTRQPTGYFTGDNKWM